MIDVAFYLPRLGGGGAEMHAVRLAAGLMNQGVRPTYVVGRGPGSYDAYLPDAVETVVLPTGRINSSQLRLVRSVRPLARFLTERRPAVLAPVLVRPAFVALQAASRAAHRPAVVPLIQNTLRRPMGAPGLYERIEDVLVRRWLPRSDRVVALSHGVAKDIAVAVPALDGRVDVIHNVGVPLPDQLTVLETVTPITGRLRYIACGRLVEQKGYSFLLDAFAEVIKTLDAELHILGDGPLRAELEAKVASLGIAGRVTFLGFRKNPFAHMKAADVFVLSSLWEGFGNVIVEAMAMGRPVVVTDCNHGPAEIITHEENGLLVPPRDANALAAAMLRVGRDEALRTRLAEAGARRAQAFDANSIAKSYADVFKRVAAERAAR